MRRSRKRKGVKRRLLQITSLAIKLAKALQKKAEAAAGAALGGPEDDAAEQEDPFQACSG